MKDQYFGDINDYRKYGLLRAFQATAEGRLLVAWMLTPDDGRGEGGLRGYLSDPQRWRHHDPDLYDGLASLLRSAPAPRVSLIEASGLLPNTTYYSEVVPDQRRERDTWRQGLFAAARAADLVFLDPDNGIEVASRPVGRKDSSKYVAWIEVEGLFASGCSLLIYQQFRRERRGPFARKLASELKDRTGAYLVEAFRTPRVLFLLAAQGRHVPRLRPAFGMLSRRWGGQIEAMGYGVV